MRGSPLAEKLYLALVQTRFATGTHELYQLPLTLRHRDDADTRRDDDAVAQTPNWTVSDALVEPSELIELVTRMEAGSEIEAGDGNFSLPSRR